jgi:multimeric flavodoxin WrbA
MRNKTVGQKTIVVLGTARNDSNTLKALLNEPAFSGHELIDLQKLKISPYSYKIAHDDDFLSVAEKMIAADRIVFATPVYWYAMSGILKIFFDRLTELITTSKNLGRALAGKDVYLFSTGSDLELPNGFEVPFVRTCQYFNMNYQKSFYVCTADWK